MKTEQTFKTKTGFCHILTDKIVLTRDGIIGNISELTTRNISQTLIIYGVLTITLFSFAFQKFEKQKWFGMGIFLGFGIYLIYNIVNSRKFSASPLIERGKIKNVEFRPAKKFLTRSYFKVDFKQNNGKIKSRLIMLPGSLNDGKNETENALEIMKSAGLIKNNAG